MNYRKIPYCLSRMRFLFLLIIFLLPWSSLRSQAATYKGIDVSRWQGTINWSSVKRAGIDFTMIGIGRLNGNTRIPDTQLTANLKGASANGIHVGVYLYSLALTEAQARKEAQFVLDMIDGYEITYPVAFDIEDASHLRLTTKQRTDITIAFLEVIEAAGYYPMIYASQDFFYQSLDLTRLTKYDKWVACWTASRMTYSNKSMWQYSSTGRVNGISTAVDLDISYKDYSKLISPRTTSYGWMTDGTHTWYVTSKGKKLTNCFKKIDGKKYYFDANGYRVTGLMKKDGSFYYFDKNGQLQYGWIKIGTRRFYGGTKTGAFAIGSKVIDGSTYYFNSIGVMQTGFVTVNGKTSYYGSGGKLKTGFFQVGGKTYYAGKKGVLKTGFCTIDGARYYFNTDHTMQTGLSVIGSATYYFNKKGIMQTGLKKIGKKARYFGTGGKLKTGWFKVGKKTYYADSQGILASGQVVIDGELCTFARDYTLTKKESCTEDTEETEPQTSTQS